MDVYSLCTECLFSSKCVVINTIVALVCPQDMLYVWTEPKLCMGGVPLPKKRTLACENMDFVVRLSASVGALTAVLLVIPHLLLLEEEQEECEMPGADSCAVMEGEENDMEDEVVYTKPRCWAS
ncbi:hypothetical protein CRUP_018818 [Coryphaenoides rupestris]|nr:hypothetical protein CRUP_018818 [Coryphaenoides rupestris]